MFSMMVVENQVSEHGITKDNFLTKTLTPYNITKCILMLSCVIFFVMQSFGEMEKFFSNMTSVSTRTVTDLKIRKPTIVVCLKEPFKIGKYPQTMDEYRKLTYSFGEIFAKVHPGESEGLKVTDIATYWYGMCFVLEVPDTWDAELTLTFNTGFVPMNMYYVDKGQELCIIYGLHFCNVYIKKVVLASNQFETQVRVRKRVRSPGYGVFVLKMNINLKCLIHRTCVSYEGYNQYECIQEHVNERLRQEIKCSLPHHIHNNVNTGKDICANMSEFQGESIYS